MYDAGRAREEAHRHGAWRSRECRATPRPTRRAWSSRACRSTITSRSATNDDTTVTQYTMTTLEELGLLKMDFLGLAQHHGHRRRDFRRRSAKRTRTSPWTRVTDNDPKVMEMLTQGRTAGVFQMESARHDRASASASSRSPLKISPSSSRPTAPARWTPSRASSPASTTRSLVKYKHPLLGAHPVRHLRLHPLSGAGH